MWFFGMSYLFYMEPAKNILNLLKDLSQDFSFAMCIFYLIKGFSVGANVNLEWCGIEPMSMVTQ